MQLYRIQSEENIKISEINAQYEVAIKKQEQDRELFIKALKESNYRFNRQTKNAEKLQAEFSQLIRAITKKMINGHTTQYECKMLEHFTSLKVQALEKSFNVSEGFLNMFTGGV
jgi:isopropylmalate/homocitrate/citramalate synthase